MEKIELKNKDSLTGTISLKDLIIKPKYDAEADLRGIEHQLSFSPLRLSPIENDSERASSWYESRLAEIAAQEELFRQRLEEARKRGEIDASDYFRFTAQKLGSYGVFNRVRQNAEETYRDLFKKS